MYELPERENVVLLWQRSPSKPSVQLQLARWSDSPTSHGTHVPPFRHSCESSELTREKFLRDGIFRNRDKRQKLGCVKPNFWLL